ncbi:hypothetical protein DN752_19220 [Echinicola strongylocentroti]|uniref:Uncharacterized protein n=1 Tax=Echinicola strongylocentroti TaxID=1795355 RepID=A0A2Z4IMG6_9BACT|nr:hypothetical protein [Echinicola strongylocentroti]AWW32095.1 hypothetical protein DN752_19220 [Echinicola strongylocentroti]
MRQVTKGLLAPVVLASVFTFSCTDDEEPIIAQEGVEKANLVFTEIEGDDHLSAHGDHFHGLDEGTEGESFVVEFDADGHAVSGGHLHLHADGIYKMELQAWDYEGNRVEEDFIKDKATADLYKAFLVGGDLVLNPDTEDETGAIFQPREKEYADGTAVDGKYETTGVLSYFTIGEANEGETKAVDFVLRKFNDAATKSLVERVDWNAEDYAERFAGEDVLTLEFEIHAEHEEGHEEEGHDH